MPLSFPFENEQVGAPASQQRGEEPQGRPGAQDGAGASGLSQPLSRVTPTGHLLCSCLLGWEGRSVQMRFGGGRRSSLAQ